MRRPIDDQERLLKEQYHNVQKLSARIRIHERFSTASQDLHLWFFDHLLQMAPAEARILEAGCGRGDIWRKNAERIPAGWQVRLTDFSAGMVADCKAHLGPELVGRFDWAVMDVQAIPEPDASFDVVIANMMLYHVPDRARAIGQVRRVLKPDGVLLALTIGEHHMEELMLLAEKHVPGLVEERDKQGFIVGNFNLENGEAQLREQFSEVRIERFADSLFVTEVQPVIDYIGSMERLDGEGILQQHEAAIRAELEGHLAADGGFRVTKSTGLFIASGNVGRSTEC
jgi:ubiquinone/menaquinone biosynthesis C-methylase UbiE